MITPLSKFRVNHNFRPNRRAIIVDNFYEDPYSVREYALQQEFVENEYYIGRRTVQQFLFPGIKEQFETILNCRITKWEDYGMNGRFQWNKAGDPLVWHNDLQRWAGMIYLTPDAPPQCGTGTYRHKASKVYHKTDPRIMEAFDQNCFIDGTPYEQMDVFANVFNRLVLFDGGQIHAAQEYFGYNKENARMWHMFFFDAED